MGSDAARRDELVHDAAAAADEFVFCALRGLCQRRRIERAAVVGLNVGVEPEAVGLACRVARHHAHLRIVAWRPGDDAAAVDGAGQHEAVVVIGVLADQVDAAVGLREPLALAPERLQQGQTRGCSQQGQAHGAGSEARSAR